MRSGDTSETYYILYIIYYIVGYTPHTNLSFGRDSQVKEDENLNTDDGITPDRT